MFLGPEADHAWGSNYAFRVFGAAADGVYPPEKRRRGYHTDPCRVHSSREPFPGIPVPTGGIHRAKVEQLAECCWAPLIPGLTPHGLHMAGQIRGTKGR